MKTTQLTQREIRNMAKNEEKLDIEEYRN